MRICHCCGSEMFIPDLDFYRPRTKRRWKKINQLSNLLFVEQVWKESIDREFKYFNQQLLHCIYIFSLSVNKRLTLLRGLLLQHLLAEASEKNDALCCYFCPKKTVISAR